MALFDPILDLAGYVLVAAGIVVAIGGVPYAVLTGQTPVLRSGLLYSTGGTLILFGGVILHPKTYEGINLSGFEERPESAIWAAFALVSFGTYIFP